MQTSCWCQREHTAATACEEPGPRTACQVVGQRKELCNEDPQACFQIRLSYEPSVAPHDTSELHALRVLPNGPSSPGLMGRHGSGRSRDLAHCSVCMSDITAVQTRDTGGSTLRPSARAVISINGSQRLNRKPLCINFVTVILKYSSDLLFMTGER